MYARQSSGLQSNTKARNAAVHSRLHAVGAEKRHGVTKTYRALARKLIFRTFSCMVTMLSKMIDIIDSRIRIRLGADFRC